MKSERGMRRRIAKHIADLGHPDPAVSSRAECYLLRWYATRAVDDLIAARDHPNPVVRFRAVWVLGYSHDARALDTILRLTDDPDEGVRYDATIALGTLGDDRAIEPLRRMLLACDETRPAGMAFGRMGPRTVPVLAELAQADSSDVRHTTVNVLGNFAVEHGDRRSLEILQQLANDPDADIRADAQFWLDELAQPALPRERP